MKLTFKILNKKMPVEVKSVVNHKMEETTDNLFEQITTDIKMRAQQKDNYIKLSDPTVALEPSTFKGVECEEFIDVSTFYDLERIKNETQASDFDIGKAMSNHPIVIMNGHYRLVDYKFEIQAAVLMLAEFDEKLWEIDEIDKEMLYDRLKKVIPRAVYNFIFHKYADLSIKKKLDANQLYKFNVLKTTRLLAHVLLRESPKNNYEEFMEAWAIVCPKGLAPKLEYLYGTVLTTWNTDTLRKEIKLFPESDLPHILCERIDALFSAEEQWTHEEIRPYLLKYVSREQPLSSILSTYAIQMEEHGIKYYVSKFRYPRIDNCIKFHS